MPARLELAEGGRGLARAGRGQGWRSAAGLPAWEVPTALPLPGRPPPPPLPPSLPPSLPPCLPTSLPPYLPTSLLPYLPELRNRMWRWRGGPAEPAIASAVWAGVSVCCQMSRGRGPG